MAKLLEGRPIAQSIKDELKLEIRSLKTTPVLASVQVGENSSIASYVRSQFKAAESLGIHYRLQKLAPDTTEAALIDFITKLGSDKTVNGIIVQMPLPAQIDDKMISAYIAPQKDVEGMHPANIGKIVFGTSTTPGADGERRRAVGKQSILPPTAAAVMELLSSTGVDLYGKEAVVVGHSEIIGKPVALMLLEKFATVTVTHIGTSKAGKLEDHIRRAEVLVVAVGKAELIKGDWIRENAIVIDVGINHAGGKIVGDVEFAAAVARASYITPVPGGVGALTPVMLMRNLVEAAKLQQ